MFVSKRLLILPLGLLITLPGCSGSRLQQMFAPDRDFMTLSELDEYESLQRGPTSSVVSRDADEKSEGGGLPDVVGWLRPKSKNNDTLSPNPFLEDNYDAEADKRQPIVTVELSQNLGKDAEQLGSKNDTAFQSATTSEIAATAEKTVKRSSDAITFADIMSEFEESAENLSTEPDIIDAMEEAWLEEQSAESQTVSDCDTLMTEAIDDGSPKSQSCDDGLTLDFDMLNDEPSEKDDEVPTLNLAETNRESEKSQELISGLAASEAFDSFEDSSTELLPNAADFLDSETADDQSLLQSSDSSIDWKSPDSDDSEDLSKSSLLSDHFTVGNRNCDPVTEEANSSLQLPSIVQSSSAASSLSQQPAVGQSFTNGNPQPLRIANSQSQTLSDDPFLNDFTTQAAAPARATDSNIPAGSSIGKTQNVSVRTWLMLLGTIVIAYLLFAPEQKKQRHQNDR